MLQHEHTALLHRHVPASRACVCTQERLTTSNPNLAEQTAAHGMPAGMQDPDTPVEDDPYADRRWREIKLQPHGHRFTEKVQQLFRSADLSAGESLSCSLWAPGDSCCDRCFKSGLLTPQACLPLHLKQQTVSALCNH